MAFIKVAVFGILATAIFAAPPSEAQSYASYSSGPLESHQSLPLTQTPISFSHAPVAISHAPVAISHAPVQLHEAAEVEHYAPPQYEFKYGVRDEHTHDIKEQAEKRVGDRVEGYYSLVEPDGTTRTVHYTADKHTGFNAVVTKSGKALHPAAPVRVAVPVPKVVAAPVISYARPAPLISYSQAPVAALAPSHSPAGSATSYSSTIGRLGQQSGRYH